MKIQDLFRILEKLTGSPPANLSNNTEKLIENILNKSPQIDFSQFNELLLLCNKSRVSSSFFKFFFSDHYLRLDEIEKGVEKFQQYAILKYGNFYNAFSILNNSENINSELSEYNQSVSEKLMNSYRTREPKLIDIKHISRDDTYYVGYLCGAEIKELKELSETFLQILDLCWLKYKNKSQDLKFETLTSDLSTTIDEYFNEIQKPLKHNLKYKIKSQFEQAINDFKMSFLKNGNLIDFKKFNYKVKRSIEKKLTDIKQLETEISSIQLIGERNTEIYLTWDYLDVYFATSMRTKWDYISFYDFVQNVIKDENLSNLNLRYFDPTQSYCSNRIDKGLIEALMLKRAKCTIYSVQETDTLGKDSELASTLAQGKPVIAFVPMINSIEKHAEYIKESCNSDFEYILYKIQNLKEIIETNAEVFQECHESFPDTNVIKFINTFSDKIACFNNMTKWIKTKVDFIKEKKDDINKLCHILAIADKHFYDKRANNLKNKHPLGIQVNLSNGVANGVFVTRTVEECQNLLYNLLINNIRYKLEEDKDCWMLKDELTNSIHRVVTKNYKLTNSFWNFYINNK
jgi:hypothetical protein